MRSRHFSVVIGIALVLLAAQGAFAITVTVNDQPLPSQPPAVEAQGRVLLPMRAVFEALGAEVNWMEATQTVTGTLGDRTVRMQIGNHTAYVNDQPVLLDVPAELINGYTYIPVRFPAEALGANVSWYPNTQTVAVALAAEVPSPPPPPTPWPRPQPPIPLPPPPPEQTTVNGTLSAITPDRIAVTVGQNLRVFDIANSTIVLRQGQQVGLRDLAVGEPVTVVYDQAGNVVIVRTDFQTIRGTVQARTARDLLLDTQAQPLQVSPQVRVTDPQGRTINYGNVQVGDRVELRVDPNTYDIFSIALLPTPVAVAPVVSISGNIAEPLVPGDSFIVTVRATPGSQVSVDVGNLMAGIPLPEVERGIYAAEIVAPVVQSEQRIRVRAHVTPPNGRMVVAQAPVTITIVPSTAVAVR